MGDYLKHSEAERRGLSDVWERRWAGRFARPTLLGRRMFAAKKKALQKALCGINVSTVMEAGCGSGYTGEVFKNAGLNYRGIDISATAVALCRSRGLNVEQIAIEDVRGSYDLVASDGLLEHQLNFEPAACHMMRLSREYVLLIQPNHDSITGKTLAYLSEIFRQRANVFEYNYRIGDFIRVFDRNSFELVRSEPIFSDVFRLLLFKRKNPWESDITP